MRLHNSARGQSEKRAIAIPSALRPRRIPGKAFVDGVVGIINGIESMCCCKDQKPQLSAK